MATTTTTITARPVPLKQANNSQTPPTHHLPCRGSTCWPLLPADLVQHDLPDQDGLDQRASESNFQSSPSAGDLGESSEFMWSTYKINSASGEPQVSSPRTPRPTLNSAGNVSSWSANPNTGVRGDGSSTGNLNDSTQSVRTEYGEPSLPTPSTSAPLASRTKVSSSRSPLSPLSSLGSFDTERKLSNNRSPTTPEEPLPKINPTFEARLPRTAHNNLGITTLLQQQQRQAEGRNSLPPVDSNPQKQSSVWSWNLHAPEFVPSAQRHPITALAPNPDLDLIRFDSPPLQPQSFPDVDYGILLDRDWEVPKQVRF